MLFKFQEDDPVITGYIKGETLADVERWQTRDDYDFELHSGHLTGFPIYIRTVQYAHATSNIPKFDTLNKSADDYTKISDFANADKLGSLPLPTKTEILALIAGNWEAFSELAQNYWNNTPVSTKTREEIEHEAWVNAETSETGQHFDQVSLNHFRSMYCL